MSASVTNFTRTAENVTMQATGATSLKRSADIAAHLWGNGVEKRLCVGLRMLHNAFEPEGQQSAQGKRSWLEAFC